MGLDTRIGPQFLQAGLGYGGSCFPKDVTALKQLAGNTGYHFQLLTAVIEVNELQKRRAIGKLQKHLGSLVGKEIALLGRRLQAEHRRHPRGDQPGARRPAPERGRARARLRPGRRRTRRASCSAARASCDSALEALDGADAAVLVTEWPEFARARLGRRGRRRAWRIPLVVDGRNFLDRDALRDGRLHLRGRRPVAPDAGTRPRRRRGHAAAAAHAHHCRSRSCRWPAGRS